MRRNGGRRKERVDRHLALRHRPDREEVVVLTVARILGRVDNSFLEAMVSFFRVDAANVIANLFFLSDEGARLHILGHVTQTRAVGIALERAARVTAISADGVGVVPIPLLTIFITPNGALVVPIIAKSVAHVLVARCFPEAMISFFRVDAANFIVILFFLSDEGARLHILGHVTQTRAVGIALERAARVTAISADGVGVVPIPLLTIFITPNGALVVPIIAKSVAHVLERVITSGSGTQRRRIGIGSGPKRVCIQALHGSI